jgi:CBS domain-containing protein
MKVKDAMHKGTLCLEPGTPVKEIAKRMRDSDVGAIPIRADGKLVGIVTDRDITCRAVTAEGDISKMTAQDVMTKTVLHCAPEDDLASAIKIMETKKVRRLPVVDGHKEIVGMLSLGDISHNLGKELSGEVLRAVSAHHR